MSWTEEGRSGGRGRGGRSVVTPRPAWMVARQQGVQSGSHLLSLPESRTLAPLTEAGLGRGDWLHGTPVQSGRGRDRPHA